MSSGTPQEPDAQNASERAFAEIFRPGLKKEQVDFLEAFLHHASLRAASKETGHDKSRHYEWLRSALYFECFKEAQRQIAVALESEAVRRAVEGVQEPIYSKNGKLVGHRRKYSDALLLKLLEANNPEKFKVTEKKPDNNDVRVNVYIPDNRRERVPMEGEPEVVKFPGKGEGPDGNPKA